MVEEIEEFHTELSGDMFRNFEILINAQVHVPSMRSRAESDSRISDLPQLEAIDSEHVGIQICPGISTASPARLTSDAVRPFEPSRVAVAHTGRVTQALDREQGRDRRSAGDGDDRAGFPASEELANEPVPTG